MKKQRTKYFIRYRISRKGAEEIKVPVTEARKLINQLLREDKELLKILAKL